MGSREKNNTAAGSKMEAVDVEETVGNILTILSQQLLLNFPLNCQRLQDEIGEKVAAGKPIDMLLPAFPCKSINKDKVLGVQPDMAEFRALCKLVRALRDIEAVYTPGAYLTIFSDYHTFARYISVGSGDYLQYHFGLLKLIHRLGADEIIRIENFSSHDEFKQREFSDDFEYQTMLEELYGDPAFKSGLDSQIKACDDMRERYVGLKTFMKLDQDLVIKYFSRSSRTKILSNIAKGMMISGEALDTFLKAKYPGALRLSIHYYGHEGSKSSISLLEDSTIKTPWHNTLLFDASTGQFLADKKRSLMTSASDELVVLKVSFEGTDWMLLRLRAPDANRARRMGFIRATLCKESFGLILESPEDLLDVGDIHQDNVTHMLKQFGVVFLRGFKKSSDPEQLEAWYGKRGKMIYWPGVGHTKVIKDIPNDETGPDFVTSKESLPVHFDLMIPPPYFGVDQSKHGYEDTIPKEVVLYCHRAAGKGKGGASILVDAAQATLMISGQAREIFRKTVIAYGFTKAYEGEARAFEYPALMRCPWTGRDVFRCTELWNEETHPGSAETLDYKVVSSQRHISPEMIDKLISKILKDDRVNLELDFEDGDYVLVNNYTTLHGRTEYSDSARELWRIQTSPPTDNVPWHKPEVVKKMEEMDAASKSA